MFRCLHTYSHNKPPRVSCQNLISRLTFLTSATVANNANANAEAPPTFVFQRWTGRRQSHCDWLLSSLEGVADPVGGQRRWVSADLLARLSLAEPRRRAESGSLLGVRMKE